MEISIKKGDGITHAIKRQLIIEGIKENQFTGNIWEKIQQSLDDGTSVIKHGEQEIKIGDMWKPKKNAMTYVNDVIKIAENTWTNIINLFSAPTKSLTKVEEPITTNSTSTERHVESEIPKLGLLPTQPLASPTENENENIPELHEAYTPAQVPSTLDEASTESIEMHSIEFHARTTNRQRLKSSTNGDFCTDWIERDAYGSTTYEDWLTANGYEYDKENGEKMRNKCAQKAKSSKFKRRCGAAYRESAQSLGLWENMDRQQSAYQFASELAKNPNYKELPHNIVKNMDLGNLPAGCVIVYDAGYTSGSHRHGHIGVTLGQDKYGNNTNLEYGGYCPRSPRKDNSITIQQGKKNDHIRVFVPIVKKTD